jgi:hypothetical protein
MSVKNKRFVCSDCGEKFLTSTALRNHVEEEHGGDVELVDDTPG